MTTVRAALVETMARLMPSMIAETVAEGLPSSVHREAGSLDLVEVAEIVARIESRLHLFASGRQLGPQKMEELRRMLTAGRDPGPATATVPIATEGDVLAAQRATRALVRHFFGSTDCIRLITVVSELARNIYMYAGSGAIELSVEQRHRVLFSVTARDSGPGIKDVDAILTGRFVSKTGLGRGLIGSRGMLDDLQIMTSSRGTTVRALKYARSAG